MNFTYNRNIWSQLQLKAEVTDLTGLISNTKSFTLLRDTRTHPLIPDSRLSRGTSQDNGRWILVVSKFPVSTRLVTRFSHASTNGYGWLGYTISDHRCIHHWPWPGRNRVDVRFLSIVRDLRAANMVTLRVRAHSSAKDIDHCNW